MANTAGLPTATKANWQARATPTADTYKCALYTSSGTLAPGSSTVYTSSGEVTGTNYVAGGVTLSGATISTSGTSAYIDFNDISFVNVTLTGVVAAAIYNTSKSNEIIGIYTFASQSPTAQNLNLTLPAPGATAVVRID